MTTTTNTTTQTNVRLFVLFVLVVVSSTGVFGQNTTTVLPSTTSTQVSISKEATMTITTENGVASNSDFAVWFTGAQSTNNVKTTATNFGKKQLINSGVKTNSVLIRSFLKKVISQESSVA
jgi:hypothetical protein